MVKGFSHVQIKSYVSHVKCPWLESGLIDFTKSNEYGYNGRGEQQAGGYDSENAVTVTIMNVVDLKKVCFVRSIPNLY